MLTFRYQYFLLAILIFLIEVFIALFVHDDFIRPNVGDFLVVILIYCFVRAFANIQVWKAAIGVLLFSYAIEILQYLQLVKLLGLENNKAARTIIGTSFSWLDILAYTLGIGFVIIMEMIFAKKNS